MNKLKQLFKWLPVPLLLLCSLFIYTFFRSCRFLALVILIIAGVYTVYLLLRLLKKHHKKAGTVMLAVFYCAAALGLSACIWAGCLIGNAMGGTPDTTCDYMIILGAGVRGTVPSLSLQERIDAAYEYMTAHPQVQCIASGGQGSGEDISEAQCIYDHLTARGIDGSRIWLEDLSTSTRENIRYSLALIEEKTGNRPEQAGILSSEYHLYRAGRFASQENLTAIGIPAKTERFGLFLSYYTREIAAVLYYSIFG